MDWTLAIVVALVCFAVLRLRSKRRRDYYAQAASMGMLRSPLYLVRAVLLCSLLGLILAAAHIQHDGPLAAWVWLAALGLVLIALFFVRRALQWRYPV